MGKGPPRTRAGELEDEARRAGSFPSSISEIGVVGFKIFFFDVDYFKVFVECATILLLLLLMFWIFDCNACGILVPNQGSNLHPLGWKAWF